MRPLKHHTCARCGHEWKTSAYNTRRCPDCGSYHWTNSPKKYNCTKCDHTWAGKTDEPPKRCPNCRSTVWNVHKKSGGPPPESYEPVASSIHSAVIGEKNVKKILLLYRKGNSCTSISLAMDLSFDMVFDVVSNEYPLAKIRS
jgi:DNA-directed RNA polymerase subunit RPC12/RpoP